jgi:phosphoglycerate dehydrogenase-like enzyme
VGLGSINSALARLAHAVGMVVLATRRDPAGGRPTDVDELLAREDLLELAARSDVVVAALPETDETLGLFDDTFFAAMRPGSLFCTVGRGSAVVDGDLHRALRSGHLGGAALDVFAQEPLGPDDPYWSIPRVQVSAHCSSVPAASIAAVHAVFATNLRRFLAGEPLTNEVDLSRGY